MPTDPIKIRSLKRQDVQSALKIQRKITGRSPKAGWKKELETHIKDYPQECLAAEYAGILAGFIIGEVKTLKFGVEKSGWIVIVGVDPEFMGQGIGKKLGKKLLSHFKRKGIKQVFTAVPWDSSDMLAFFKSLGFERSEFINLERRL
ncbi:MAG: GNAT family N-acetyltransferase [Candidatus Thermoplasmatota archaeon]|nr:GNAT family N-acetyltransferase [Candidatus Thermoplasmatota archaeon]